MNSAARKSRPSSTPSARCEEALTAGVKILASFQLWILGYTLGCDEWVSHAKSNYEGYRVTRPGLSPSIIVIASFSSDGLSGNDFGREFEEMLLICKRPGRSLGKEKSDYLNVAREVNAIFSDSSGVNVEARRIGALRHPQRVRSPRFAHLAALYCADVMRSAKAAKVVPVCINLVTFFHAYFNKWLPRLRAAMAASMNLFCFEN